MRRAVRLPALTASYTFVAESRRCYGKAAAVVVVVVLRDKKSIVRNLHGHRVSRNLYSDTGLYYHRERERERERERGERKKNYESYNN